MGPFLKAHPYIALAVSLAICFGAAGFASAYTIPSVRTWYTTIAKPSWWPPNWLLAPGVDHFVRDDGYRGVAGVAPAGKPTGRSGRARGVCDSIGIQYGLVAHFFRNAPARRGAGGYRGAVAGHCADHRFVLEHFENGPWLLVPYLAWVTFAMVLNGAICDTIPAQVRCTPKRALHWSFARQSLSDS